MTVSACLKTFLLICSAGAIFGHDTIQTKEGARVTLPCGLPQAPSGYTWYINADSDRGNMVGVLSSSENKHEFFKHLDDGESIRATINSRNGDLTIYSVRNSDQNLYICTSANQETRTRLEVIKERFALPTKNTTPYLLIESSHGPGGLEQIGTSPTLMIVGVAVPLICIASFGVLAYLGKRKRGLPQDDTHNTTEEPRYHEICDSDLDDMSNPVGLRGMPRILEDRDGYLKPRENQDHGISSQDISGGRSSGDSVALPVCTNPIMDSDSSDGSQDISIAD